MGVVVDAELVRDGQQQRVGLGDDLVDRKLRDEGSASRIEAGAGSTMKLPDKGH